MADASKVQAQVKQIMTIYRAMAIAQLILGVAVFVLITTVFTGKPDYDLAITFQKIALFIVPVSMAAGFFLFRYQLSQIVLHLPLEEKLKRYFSMVLVRSALFEMGFLFCCVAALVTGVQLFLWMAPIVFLVFLLIRPTPEGIGSDLQLSQTDRDKLTLL